MSFAASKAQRDKVRHATCLVCGRGDCDPAHLIPKSLCRDPDGDPLRVVPICRTHHRLYDTGRLDLSPYLEPRWRLEFAEAVRLVGGWQAMNRITNARWVEERRAA